ncbi:MAG: hypothetical protein IPL32_12310 [Chloracidobacterium sp.]|nr:hypothetical protein [Chloracidobacterium sp.]
MPETPKEKRDIEKEKNVEREKDSWREDQKKHEYYYDDAHGYEEYDPNEPEVEDDEA